MGWYGERVLPWATDKMLDNPEIARLRGRAVEGLHGTVVEIGFGSGLNVPHYPASVTEVLAVDPATRGRDLARARLEASPVPVSFVGLDGAELPIETAAADAVLCTFTLCSIERVDDAIGEIKRVLKPGGRFHFVEHGRADEARPQQIQRTLTPVWRRVAGGCHLDRHPGELLEASGFEVSMERPPSRGPKTMATFYLGTATAG